MTAILRPRALVLDMDGLLVDSEPLWCEVERDFARARGGSWTAELAAACTGKGLANTLRVMSNELHITVDLEHDALVIVESFIARASELVLKPGARELIDVSIARRIPIALGSSSASRLVRAVLERFELTASFAVIVSGDDVAHTKPAPDIFLKAAALLGVAPSDCVVLEDSLAGVTAGRAAVMQVIAVPEGESRGRGFETVADHVVSNLHEARRLLGW